MQGTVTMPVRGLASGRTCISGHVLRAGSPGRHWARLCPPLRGGGGTQLAARRGRQGAGAAVPPLAAEPRRVNGATGTVPGRLKARRGGHEHGGGDEEDDAGELGGVGRGDQAEEEGEEKGLLQGLLESFPRPAIAAGFLAVAVGAYIVLQQTGLSPLAMVEDSIDEKHPISPFIFGVTYVLSTVAFIPASVLTLGAGYMYGPLEGTALVSVSSTLGAGAAFLISRYVARPYIEERLLSNRKFRAVDTAIANEGYKVIFLLRLSPLVPFNLSNYLYGISNVPFLQYMIASWAGMLPGTLAYVQLGSMGRAGVEAAQTGVAGGEMDAARLALYVLGAVATLVAAKLAADTAERAEEGMFDGDEEEGPPGQG